MSQDIDSGLSYYLFMEFKQNKLKKEPEVTYDETKDLHEKEQSI